MFCLEAVKSTEMVLNPIGCDCQFKSHGSCLQAWFEQKNQYECPICHTVSVPAPPQHPVYQIVYVQRESPQQSSESRITQAQQRCVLACCLGWLFWSIFISVLEYVKTH